MPQESRSASISPCTPNGWIARQLSARSITGPGATTAFRATRGGKFRKLTSSTSNRPIHQAWVQSVSISTGREPIHRHTSTCHVTWDGARRSVGPARRLGFWVRDSTRFTPNAPRTSISRRKMPTTRNRCGIPHIPHTRLDQEITLDRLNGRHSLLQQLDAERQRAERSAREGSWKLQRERAWSLITSSKVRDAFDLDKVDPRVASAIRPRSSAKVL